MYAHMKRVGELPLNTDCHVFRQGIKPVWEDDANARGGKWMIRLRKNLAARLWEHLVLPCGVYSPLTFMAGDCARRRPV